jgi:hypothetical protein
MRPMLLALLMLFVSAFAPLASAQQPIPLGCWKDQGDPQGTAGRDLNGYMFVAPVQLPMRAPGRPPLTIDRTPPGTVGIVRPPPPGMTTAMCTTECANRGFMYAGTQFGSYCFCGNQPYGRSGLAPPPGCNVPCSGNANERCGGTWANSVYWTRFAAVPQQGWTGTATCQIDIRGPSYMDSRTHTWTLVGPPTPVGGGEEYRAVWSVVGSGSKSEASGSAQWTVMGGAEGRIKFWVRSGTTLVVSPVHTMLSMYEGIRGTQQLTGMAPVALAAQAFEYAVPKIEVAVGSMAIAGSSNGPTTAPLGYMQPSSAQGTSACSWNFQRR